MAVVYFDSGTTNTRIYVLDASFEVLFTEKREIGSKDSAIAGSNNALLSTMKSMYDKALENCCMKDRDVSSLYASGMVTSPYGIAEIPHKELPISVERFAESVYPYYEGEFFGRVINLIPGLKTQSPDFIFLNNMRGEEIELIGALDKLAGLDISGGTAVIMPGSHTHVAYVEDGEIKGILSNFAGELFHALKTSTILSPVLSEDPDKVNVEKVREGYDCLEKFGFNRAIYIVHAMRIFNEGTEADRYSFCEGVLNGGIRQSVEYYAQHVWENCTSVVVLGSSFMNSLYETIFENSVFGKVIGIIDNPEKPYSVKGVEKLIKLRGENCEQ